MSSSDKSSVTTNHEPELSIWVRRQWNDYRKARYRLKDVSGIRWDTISGGVRARANQPYLHGFVQCDGALEGTVAHSGDHGLCPHSIKVCITKKDNGTGENRLAFQQLLVAAGPKP